MPGLHEAMAVASRETAVIRLSNEIVPPQDGEASGPRLLGRG